MRFIFGLIFGAAFSLLVAVVIDPPSTFKDETRSDTETPEPLQRDVLVSSQVTPPSTRPAIAVADVDPTPPKPTPLPESTSKKDVPPASTVALEPVTDTSPVNNRESTTALSTADEPEHSFQQAQVWAPFHSEASAQGFASRLTQQVEHPFRVDRLGPASYAVVYEYTNAKEHALLAEKIAVATGAPRS